MPTDLDNLAELYLDVIRRRNSGQTPRTTQTAINCALRLGIARVRFQDIPATSGAYLAGDEILVSDHLGEIETVLAIIHECTEWLTRLDMPGLVDDDGLPLPGELYGDVRHRLSERVQALADTELRPPTTGFARLHDTLKVFEKQNEAKYSKLQDLESTDPLSDTCI